MDNELLGDIIKTQFDLKASKSLSLEDKPVKLKFDIDEIMNLFSDLENY